jgi:uroporphyrin-III C-methyltransferase/precorrin-2 dehydrogenase/sirohydrochlorin ferrochelatase
MSGFVSIVGAGPGDPDLLTVKAVRCLAQADLVLYDALVSGEVLRHATRAHCFFVGKRAGISSIRQEAINRILVSAAREGKRVVRLKSGDPFVFGRGGEEALALACADVPYEIVPGVSSAIAAPALAGIPVTHRGTSSAFAVVSGHDEAAWTPVVDVLPPESLTLVVLMGFGARAAIAGRLVRRGWPRATPAAILVSASTPQSESWVGTLAELGSATLRSEHRGPAVLVVGRVASLASSIGSAASAAVSASLPGRAAGA